MQAAIFDLEHIHAGWIGCARLNIWIPNHEVIYDQILEHAHRMDYIFCKSLVACRILSERFDNTIFTGFSSIDRLNQSFEKDYGRCLHLVGKSENKGTRTLLAVWSRHPEWPQLTVVYHTTPWNGPGWIADYARSNIVIVRGPLGECRLEQLQNQCGVHICPSEVEGFGHYIVEALFTRAVVVTTNASPMNEHIDASHGVLVGYDAVEDLGFGKKYKVGEQALERALEQLFGLPRARLKAMGRQARRKFEVIDARFADALRRFFQATRWPIAVPAVKRFSALGRAHRGE